MYLHELRCRRDIFAAHNLSVPQTWDELVTVAYQLNGTDFNNDGEVVALLACHAFALPCIALPAAGAVDI